MRRKFAVLAAGIAAVAAVTATALAVVPGETPFPSPTTKDLMVTANTTNGSAPDAIHTSRFLHNATVFFHVFAASVKTKQVLTAQDVRSAFIRIPNQPNVRLTYQAPTKRNGANFVGTWQVPTTYPLGLVNFTVRFQTRDRQFGNFVQIPVDTSQLTIVK